MLSYLGKDNVFSMLVQLASIISPFLMFKMVLQSYGEEYLFNYEMVLSLVGFFSIVINLSSSHITSTDEQLDNDSSGFIVSVVFLKSCISFVCIVLTYILCSVFSVSYVVFVVSSIVIFLCCFEMHYIFIRLGVVHHYQLINLVRSLTPLFFFMFGFDVLAGMLFGFFISAVLQLTFAIKKGYLNNGLSVLKVSYVKSFLKRNWALSVTDTFVAIFTQLDSFIIINSGMHSNQVLIYVAARKLVRAMLSLQSYVYMSLYYKVKAFGRNNAQTVKAFLSILLTSFFSVLVYYFVFDEIVGFYSGLSQETIDRNVVVFYIIGLVLIFGPVKMLLVNSYIYVKEYFILHMVFTILSLFSFLTIVLNSNGAVQASTARLVVDLVYLFFTFSLLFFDKFVKKSRCQVPDD